MDSEAFTVSFLFFEFKFIEPKKLQKISLNSGLQSWFTQHLEREGSQKIITTVEMKIQMATDRAQFNRLIEQKQAQTSTDRAQFNRLIEQQHAQMATH
ncbi:hypothetical protein BpHYR1_011405 [Brachionus plicatilis]|uniref:Uncharacterized protein n=1 Tax=Brachionus plicatilis TaxID=10195 RepID=A0A3M7RQL7_BRAPC|nr:hypothetical protein BpHYR1_011405 [Brachionus plicatilis]